MSEFKLYLDLAISYYDKKEYEKADNILKKLINCDENKISSMAYYYLGKIAAINNGDYISIYDEKFDELIKYYENSNQKDPDNIKTLEELAIIYLGYHSTILIGTDYAVELLVKTGDEKKFNDMIDKFYTRSYMAEEVGLSYIKKYAQIKRENEKLKKIIKEKDDEINELMYIPGNPGYIEAKKHFDDIINTKK